MGSARRVRSYFVNSSDFDNMNLCSLDADTPRRKEAAVAHFLSLNPKLKKCGFSDDDKSNVARMKKYFNGMSESSGIEFYVFRVSGDEVMKCKI